MLRFALRLPAAAEVEPAQFDGGGAVPRFLRVHRRPRSFEREHDVRIASREPVALQRDVRQVAEPLLELRERLRVRLERVHARVGRSGEQLLGPEAARAPDDREQLPSVLVDLMRDIDIPNGLGAVGYTEADVPELVPGTMKQQRLLATAPRPVGEEDIAAILLGSIENW